MSDRLLGRAAQRASDRRFFLGSALARFARAEGLDESGLAKMLACDSADLPAIMLSRRPAGGSENFRTDVLQISARFGLDATRLAEILREVDALEMLQRVDAQQASLLIAARDWEDTEPDT